MDLNELRMLLEYRKLEIKLQFQDVRHKIGIGGRVLRAIQKSGIIETIIDSLQKPSPPQNSATETGSDNHNTTKE